tara:strand:- start:219 stop:497 length:279 start_codon:yes stop_codon:yes gene_type:complete
MFNIKIEFDGDTADVNVHMPYIALLKMFHLITEKIHPEELTHEDSFGEMVLAEFVRCLYKVNTNLIEEGEKCETERAIAEAEKIISPNEQEN